MNIKPLTSCALIAALTVALMFRLDGIAFGLPALYDPDEPIFVLLSLKLLKNGTLNPGWFGHPGTTTIYTLALLELAIGLSGQVTGKFADAAAFSRAIYTDPTVVFLPGRILMLLFGMIVLVLTWHLARRLFGDRIGAITALLIAVDPVLIRYSQIIRTDMQATIFLLLAMISSVGICRRGTVRDYVIAGLWLGIGCATKWPVSAGLTAILGSTVFRMARQPGDRHSALRGLAASSISSVIGLAAASPFIFLDYQTVLENLAGEERPRHLGATGHGIINNLFWFIAHPLQDALSLAGLGAALLGIVLGIRRSAEFGAIVVSTMAVFMLLIAAQALVWERWAVPLLPLLTIAGAVGIDGMARAMRGRFGPWLERSSLISLTAILLVLTILTARAQARERAHDTRGLAAAWARKNIPVGSTVAVEYFAIDLAPMPWRFLYPGGDFGCFDGKAELARQIDYSRVSSSRGAHPLVDQGSIPAARLGTCAADWAILTTYDRYRAEPNLFPEEERGYARFLRGSHLAAKFEPVPGKVGGPIVRIVQFSRH